MPPSIGEEKITMESEVKFRCLTAEAQDLSRYQQLLADHGLVMNCHPQASSIIDTYYDRSDYSLASSGAALRVREKAGIQRLTYKKKVEQAGALHRRIELEDQPTPAHLNNVHNALIDLKLSPATSPLQDVPTTLEDFFLSWDISPVVAIATLRSTCAIRSDGQELAEFVLDRVSFGIEEKIEAYVGIEIEACSENHVSDIETIASWIMEDFGGAIVPQSNSKLEAVLQIMESAQS
jgi:inorganic triphosphatase YgiF